MITLFPPPITVAHAQYLDPEGLALGTLMATSKRKRREILEQGYNRFSYGEENLPAWFVEEEVKHVKKQLPVTKVTKARFRNALRFILRCVVNIAMVISIVMSHFDLQLSDVTLCFAMK